MFKIKTSGTFKDVIENLEEQKNSVEGKNNWLLDLATELNSKIQIRVQRFGKGSDGNKMKEYSESYSKKKSDSGRNVSFRDLTFSGNMWQSLSSSKINSGARMFFNSASETNKARGNEMRTPFFSLTKEEKSYLRNKLNSLFKK